MVKFNSQPTTELVDITTQATLDSDICNVNWSEDDTIPSAVNYTKYGSTDISSSVGVAISGILMFNAVSADDVDPFFPNTSYTSTATAETVDTCLMHP